MRTDQQRIDITIEDVANLRRMHRQQFKRLTDAKAANDGPEAGKALLALVTCHAACSEMFDVLECLLTTWEPKR